MSLLIPVPCMIHPKRNGVAVLVRHNGKLLVCERQHCRDMNGSYQFPGGAIEECESASDAAWRELHEETGLGLIDVRDSTFEYIGTGIGHTDDGSPHVTAFYLLDVVGMTKEPVNKEPEHHSDWRWVTPEEFMALPVIALTRLIVANLIVERV